MKALSSAASPICIGFGKLIAAIALAVMLSHASMLVLLGRERELLVGWRRFVRWINGGRYGWSDDVIDVPFEHPIPPVRMPALPGFKTPTPTVTPPTVTPPTVTIPKPGLPVNKTPKPLMPKPLPKPPTVPKPITNLQPGVPLGLFDRTSDPVGFAPYNSNDGSTTGSSVLAYPAADPVLWPAASYTGGDFGTPVDRAMTPLVDPQLRPYAGGSMPPQPRQQQQPAGKSNPTFNYYF